MHKSFPFQCIFSASLPTFRKGHPLTRAVQCAVRFSTLSAQWCSGAVACERAWVWAAGRAVQNIVCVCVCVRALAFVQYF